MGLLNSPILEVAIGIVLLYLVIALVCTALNEFVSQAFNMRAETLWNAISSMLFDHSGTDAACRLYDHSLIRALAVREIPHPTNGSPDPKDRPKPSYIPSDVFSLALLDLIREQKPAFDLLHFSHDLSALSAGELMNCEVMT